ncbi:MAG: hypothetical protein AAF662_04525 [Pseudomonadota bacterium]
MGDWRLGVRFRNVDAMSRINDRIRNDKSARRACLLELLESLKEAEQMLAVIDSWALSTSDAKGLLKGDSAVVWPRDIGPVD